MMRKMRRRTPVEEGPSYKDPGPGEETDLVYEEGQAGSHSLHEGDLYRNFPGPATHAAGLKKFRERRDVKYQYRSRWRT